MDEIQAQFGKEKINKISNLSNKEIKYSKINSDESINEKEKIINNNINTNINKFSKEKPKYYFYLKIGHSYSFLGNENSDPLIIIGPNYITFFYFIFGITLLFLCFFYSFWYYLNSFYQKLGISVYLIFLISYSHASLINQGYPKNILESKSNLAMQQSIIYLSVLKRAVEEFILRSISSLKIPSAYNNSIEESRLSRMVL